MGHQFAYTEREGRRWERVMMCRAAVPACWVGKVRTQGDSWYLARQKWLIVAPLNKAPGDGDHL